MKNPYEVLWVSDGATAAEIRKAYLHALKKCHPDLNPGDITWASERTREVIEAYKELSSPGRRRIVDLNLKGPPVKRRTPAPLTEEDLLRVKKRIEEMRAKSRKDAAWCALFCEFMAADISGCGGPTEVHSYGTIKS